MKTSDSETTDSGALLQEFYTILQEGGVFMWLIILTSIVLFATVLFKCLTLNRAVVMPSSLLKLVKEYAADPNIDAGKELQKELANNDCTLALLCKTALGKQEERREDIEKAVEIKARDSVVKISSGMAIIDVVITIAPLLGLLGTASGLVGVFSGLDVKGTDHSALAKGISEALYTTIGGLAVAVPAVIAQSHFTRKIETMAAELELSLSRFIASISK